MKTEEELRQIASDMTSDTNNVNKYLSESPRIANFLIGYDYASSRSMESQWISVEERLPKSNQIDNEYLVVHSKNGTVTTMNFVQGKWHSDIIGGFVKQSLVSYWMPLPQPPTK